MNNLKSSQSNLKTLLAVGGWTHASVGFTEMVQTYKRRQQFIQYAVDYLKHHSKFNSITYIIRSVQCIWSLQIYSKRDSGPFPFNSAKFLRASIFSYITTPVAASGYPRYVFRILPNIYDVNFCKIVQ